MILWLMCIPFLVWPVLIWRNRRPHNCAWCHPNDKREGISHTICRRHQRALMREVRQLKKARVV